MSLSRQGILGAVLFIGGSVMLYAMVQKVNHDNTETAAITANAEQPQTQSPTSDLVVEPLTTDIETEERILAKKQQQRIANVKEQEKRTQAFLEENQKAANAALAKARAENELYAATRNANAIEPANAQDDISRPVVVARQAPVQSDEPAKPAQAKPDANNQQPTSASQATSTSTTQNTQVQQRNTDNNKNDNNAPPKSPINYTVKKGDGLIRLARQYNVSLEALAAANGISTHADLTLGQQLTIPSGKQVARLEREAKAAEAKAAADKDAKRRAEEEAKQKAEREKQLKAEREQEEKRQQELQAQKSAEAKRQAQQKLKEARQTVKETDAKGSFGVQVALASNQKRADEVVAKFRKAGYQVSTSQTSRGVRVMVGPERGKVAAIALKDKINSDPNVNTTGAWVLYWR